MEIMIERHQASTENTKILHFTENLSGTEIPCRGSYISNLENLLYKFSTEAIGIVLFSYRIGILKSFPGSEGMEEFMEKVLSVFQISATLQFGLPFYKIFPTPLWRKFNRQADELDQMTEKLLLESEKRNKDIPDRKDLCHFMNQEGIPSKQVLANILTLFSAGMDSTTNSLLWLIYNLGRFHSVQDKLREEIGKVMVRGEPVTDERLRKLEFLKAT
eukprot:TRINITY_DN9318_c0_g1_i1.p1 TRINITY_DN9318_c0_g1~~TRINITY_DN9318_c0_g1_i1.p1  ORF type:complete len:217 (-),score=44.03 TRINITY_DN9318_c0_g1_i1:27-677(-)